MNQALTCSWRALARSGPVAIATALFTVSLLADDGAAVTRIATTPHFAFGGIGIAGIISEGEAAFKEVLSSKSAEAAFLHLLKTGNPQAKCYALVELRLKNKVLFDQQAKAFDDSTLPVETAAGCILAKRPISSVLASIRRGDYDARASAGTDQTKP